jgi:hypothetical protein
MKATHLVQLSEIDHELKRIAMGQLTTKQKEGIIGIQVKETNRLSNVPPLFVPYDFGIDRAWWDMHVKTYLNHTSNFFKHGNLPDFDEALADEN